MKKYPDNQMNLDFNSPTQLNEHTNTKAAALKLVHSRSEASQNNNADSERERILADVVAYARTLSW